MKKTLVFMIFMCVGLICHAQNEFKEFTSARYYRMDSVRIQLAHWRTQRPEQNELSDSAYVAEYFYLKNDTLFANLPQRYDFYPVAIADTRSGKRVVSVYAGTSVTFIHQYDIAGRIKPICNVKKKAVIVLSL